MAVKPNRPGGDEDDPVFRVDTHLFRELGNYLVGRDSTALIELVKNAYDADASEVIVVGTDLHDPEAGVIVVTDNGIGMNEWQFRKGFLTIASRGKEEGTRRSPNFGRRYTGAKGIGRLAAHKLAEYLSVLSLSGKPGGTSREVLEASIDWNAIEQLATIDEVTNEVRFKTVHLLKPQPCGTRIELRNLRKSWSAEERTIFVEECYSLQAPDTLTKPMHPAILLKPLLFNRPVQRLTATEEDDFRLVLEGEFDTGDPLWQHIANTAEWAIEIDASRPDDEDEMPVVKYGIAPTRNRESQEGVKPEVYSEAHPNPEDGPFFQARILVQVNPKDKVIERQKVRRQSGIRVYVEGFRVLPYGEDGNDWLEIDANYNRRSTLDYAKKVQELVKIAELDSKWTQTLLPNRSYFGAVFVTQEDAGGLTPLINREGFLPNQAYRDLKYMVRLGIDLFTRVRAAAEFEERVKARVDRRRTKVAVGSEIMHTLEEARTSVAKVRLAIGSSATDAVKDGVADLSAKIGSLEQNLAELVTQADMIRVTASVGTQMAEFVHEVNTLLGTAHTVTQALERLRKDSALPRSKRGDIDAIYSAMADMRQQLERQASYLLDIATPDASRRRSKQRLVDRFDSGVKLVARAAKKRGIEILNEIPPGLKSPVMFPAEITTVFSNLLTNAVKNAGDNGTIVGRGDKSDTAITITMSNTGNAVDVPTSERLFMPYVSTTPQTDPTLGQGMGLGLPITRNTLERYGASIKFVRPEKGFSTTIQITFPLNEGKT